MNVSAGTVARTIVLVLALVNQILVVTGHSVLPIEDAQVETIVSTVFTIGASLVTWWKNSSFTKAAVAGDAVKNAVKNGVIDEKAVYDFVKR